VEDEALDDLVLIAHRKSNKSNRKVWTLEQKACDTKMEVFGRTLKQGKWQLPFQSKTYCKVDRYFVT